jgi:hypothetical protein
MTEPVCLKRWSIPEWWPVPFKRVHLDTATGRARVAFRTCQHEAHGEAWRCGGKWHAVFAEAGELLLQVGATRLRLAEISSFELTRKHGPWATVRIEGPGIVLAEDYRFNAGRWWNHLDPTFDGVDEDLSDFFVRLHRLWISESKGRELARARSGAAGH